MYRLNLHGSLAQRNTPARACRKRKLEPRAAEVVRPSERYEVDVVRPDIYIVGLHRQYVVHVRLGTLR